MTLSIHSIAVPLLTHMLKSTSTVLDKGAEHAAAKKIDPATLMQLRLIADMLPLMKQIQIATDMAKAGLARLSGQDAPSWPDDEKTIDDAKARIAKAVVYIEGFSEAHLADAATRDVKFSVGPVGAKVEMQFTGIDYLLKWVIPNFTFHCATAYDILRANGVEIGKRDFLGAR